LTAEYIKSSAHSGENIKSILLELVQSRKLTPMEILVVQSQIAPFFTTCYTYNECVSELELKYKNQISKEYKIQIKKSSSIETSLKKIM